MLTVQHDNQKVAYIEFNSEGDKTAKEQAEHIFADYKSKPSFVPKQPYESGNFSGNKTAIKSHDVSKWIASNTAVNAWGANSGGYWSTI